MKRSTTGLLSLLLAATPLCAQDKIDGHIEDDKGDQIVISQKPELTRLADRDGDGRAESFETVCDDYGFHGNYHEYTHGPVRDEEGNYYFTLNLSHGGDERTSWRAGGPFMGSMGGYRGWACRVTPEGKFGSYQGQMFMGDQTLSTVFRVATEKVNGVDQGSVVFLGEGLASGVMRPCFLPDGSLLLGQTGRGWRARGRYQEGLQQIVWDGKTVPADILKVTGSSSGFDVHLTSALSEKSTPERVSYL